MVLIINFWSSTGMSQFSQTQNDGGRYTDEDINNKVSCTCSQYVYESQILVISVSCQDTVVVGYW